MMLLYFREFVKISLDNESEFLDAIAIGTISAPTVKERCLV
jgi:hypothetical protein